MSTFTKIHMCISLRGALRNWNPREWKGCCTAEDGHTMTPEEVRDHFFDELAKGRKVIPMGRCDNFDYESGCQGHPCEEGEEA